MKVQWDQTLAIYGGTFDPPHLGHRVAVEGLLKNPGVARVLVVPAATPPHKPNVTASEHRLRMTELTFEGFPRVEINRMELDRAQQTGRASYTYDTLQEVRGLARSIAFAMGADQLEQMTTWWRFPEVLGLAHWIILGRKPDGIEVAHRTLQNWRTAGVALPHDRAIEVFETPAPQVSSEEIRAAIARNGAVPPQALVPSVEAYLKRNHLYGIREERS